MTDAQTKLTDAIFEMETTIHEAFAFAEAVEVAVAANCERNTVAFLTDELCTRVKELRGLWRATNEAVP